MMIIIFNMEDAQKVKRLKLVLSNILKRYSAQFIRKLILNYQSEAESTQLIRHYDVECEAGTAIKDTIQTVIHRRLMEAMLLIKLSAPRFRRNRKKALSVGQRAPQNKNKEEQSKLSMYKSSRDMKESKPNKLEQIFREVKNLSKSRTRTQAQTERKERVSFFNPEYNLSEKKEKLFVQLKQIESEFEQLLSAERQLTDRLSCRTGIGKIRKNYRDGGRNIRRIDINF